jgi:hypothetical protein
MGSKPFRFARHQSVAGIILGGTAGLSPVTAQRVAAFATLALLALPFATLRAAGHFPAFALTLALTFARLWRAELALHALRHLPPAFGQGADGLLLRAARVAPFGECFRSITHGAIRLGQRCRHIAGQFAELLHQGAECSAQRALHARVARRFIPRLRRLRAPRIATGVFRLTTPPMRAIEHFCLSPHHILKRAHLLLAALALLALAILRPARAAFFQGLEHFLKLGHFAFGIFLTAIARGIFQAAGAAFQFTAIKDALLRVIG